MRQLPQLEREFPDINFKVINVQLEVHASSRSSAVTRTLLEAILLTAS